MKHCYRFFGAKDSNWSLDPDELDHAIKVIRLKVGEHFEIFDGKGRLAIALVTEADKKRLVFTIEHESAEPPDGARFSIALGALKPSTYDDLLPPLVELGVSRLVLFQQQQVSKDRLSEKNLERFRRIMISAAKQSKRLWLPELMIEDDVLQAVGSLDGEKFVLMPDAKIHLSDALGVFKPIDKEMQGSSVVVVIGGEKGFSEAELAKIKAIQTVSLGGHILRAWTAAVAAAAISAAWQHRSRE